MPKILTTGKLSKLSSGQKDFRVVRQNNHQYLGCAGFTLLELIVVCALIGIMLSLSVPSFRTTVFSDSLKATARHAISMVREARESAARQQKPYLLYINHIENSMWLKTEDVPAADTDEDESSPDKFTLPEDVRIAGLWVAGEQKSTLEETVIWVSPDGYLAKTIISFEDEDGRTLAVEFQTFLEDAILHDQVPSL